MNIQQFRAKYPQYDALSDQDLANRLYQKHYADKLTPDDFGTRFGMAPALAPKVSDTAGNGIDTSRPMLDNPDGSFSTERTITIESDGRWFNIPTIVGGQQRSESEATDLFMRGLNPSVGDFDTVDEAVAAAQQRSQDIGRVRGSNRGQTTVPVPHGTPPQPPVATEPFPTKGAMQTGPGLGELIASLMPQPAPDGQMGYMGRGGVRAAQAAREKAVADAVTTLYPDAAGEALAKAPGAGMRAAPEPTGFRQLLDDLIGNPDAVPAGGDPNVALYLAGRQAGLDVVQPERQAPASAEDRAAFANPGADQAEIRPGRGRRAAWPAGSAPEEPNDQLPVQLGPTATAKRAREQFGPAEGVATRGAKDVASGAIQTAGGLLGYAARMTDSNALREGQLKITQKAADLMPSDPGFLDNLAAGFGSTATFFIPGMGLAKGAQAVASVSPRMAMWLGAGAAAGMEAAVEAGAVYEQALAEGKTDQEAARAADRTFWQNAGLLAVTNKLGLFGETGGQIARRTLGAAFEGGQEGVQQVISNRELEKPAGEGVGESAAIGALVGAGMSGNVGTPQERLGDQFVRQIQGAEPDPQQVDQAARDAMDPANAQQRAQPQRQEVPRAKAQPQPRQAPPQWTAGADESRGPMPANVDVPEQQRSEQTGVETDGLTADGSAEGVEPTNSLGKTASWVIRDKATGETVMETFDKRAVEALNTTKYEAVPIQQHLQQINRDAKASPDQQPQAAASAARDAQPEAPARPESSPEPSSQATDAPVRRPIIEPGKVLNLGMGARVKLNPLPPGEYWRETNENGLDSLLMDNRTKPENENITPHPSGMFVTNHRDLAIGQGGNKGVLVKFRGDALSGREHQKPGTGLIGGSEYVVDAVTADAIDEIIMPKGTKLRGLNKMELRNRFDMEDLGDGRVKYTRKGESAPQDRPSNPGPQAEQPQAPAAPITEEPGTNAQATEGPTPQPRTDESAGAGQDPVIERAMANGREAPFGDVQNLIRQATAGQPYRDGRTMDEVAQAVHDGQHEGIKRYAETQPPTPVREDDIPADLANRAFYNTSHTPEKRGQVQRREYVQRMAHAWREVEPTIKDEAARARVNEFFQQFRDGYAAKLRAYLEAHSRVASSFITGPAKFPVSANEKRSRTADRRLEEAEQFYQRGVKRLKKLATGPADNSTASQLDQARQKLAQREKAQEQMKAANKVLRSSKLSDKEKRSQLRDVGLTDKQIDAINKPDFAGRTGFKGFELSNNNAEIRRLRQRVDALEAQSTAAEQTGGAESVSFDGGQVELDHAAGVLRIQHDDKPPQETIRALKAKGFRWARSKGAWQRKLTAGARQDAEQITGAELSPADRPAAEEGQRDTKATHGPGTLASGFDPGQAAQAVRALASDAAEKLKPAADRFIYLAQDRFNSLKAKQKQIGPVPEPQDAYLAEERFHGRTRKRLDLFDEQVVQPMLQAIRGSGLTLEQVEQWLHARHAAEANAHLKSINPKMPDNDALSGMTDAEAARILAQHQDNSQLQQVGAMVDDMNAERLAIIENEELDTPENVAAIREAYDHYVPLHREEVEHGGMPARGQGFNVKGKETKRRVGSHRAVENILPHLVAQFETTVIRAEKARVHRALYELATAHPDPDFWTVDKAATKRVVGPDGLVRNAGDPRYKERDNVLTVKKGGEEYTIEFNPNNVYAVRIAHGMKNLEQAQMGWLLRKMSTINRWLSAVNTGWNPEFVISNLVRDLQTAVYNLNGTEAEKLGYKVMKDWPKALRGIHSAVRGDKSHTWAKHFDEFEREGGRTGWMAHYETIDDMRQKLVREFDSLGDGGWAMTKRRANQIATLVRDYNDIVENAIRLSVYVNAKHSGLTAAKAASIAKNITVNFNRKGAAGPALNAAYLFFNASIQGSARLIQAVATSRRAQAMVGGTILMATILDIMNRDLGGDDDDGVPYYDKVPDYVKERNLVIMRDDGDYLTIPLPWGYNVFHVVGQELGSAYSKEGFSAIESAGRVAGSILGAFSPIGSEGSGLQMVSPTLLDPAVQIAENKDFTGRKLMPVNFGWGAVTPDSELYWNGARDTSKALARWMNEITGGNRAKPGAIDISPETIDLWIDFATGGLGRTAANTADTVGKLIEGEPLEDRNTPLVRKLKGKVTRAHDQTEYYDNLAEVQTIVAQLKTYSGQPDMLRAIKDENRALLPLIAASKRAEKEMRKLRKARRQAIGSGDKALQERIEGRMDRVFKWFNTEYREAESRNKAEPLGEPRHAVDQTDDGEI